MSEQFTPGYVAFVYERASESMAPWRFTKHLQICISSLSVFLLFTIVPVGPESINSIAVVQVKCTAERPGGLMCKNAQKP